MAPPGKPQTAPRVIVEYEEMEPGLDLPTREMGNVVNVVVNIAWKTVRRILRAHAN